MVDRAYPLIEHTDLTDKIYDILKEKILRREVGPGDRLSVEDIAEMMGVSRTPVKDAINRLASEGLVDIQSRRGTFVASLEQPDIVDLFEMRRLFETYAAEQWFKRGKSPELIEKIKRFLKEMAVSADGDRYTDYARFMDNDHDFHRAIIASVANKRLIQLYEELGVHIQVARAHYVRNVQSARDAQQEHQAIVEAFEKGNLSQIRASLTRHIDNVESALLAAIEGNGI